jgi:hypothetical protein
LIKDKFGIQKKFPAQADPASGAGIASSKAGFQMENILVVDLN